jgi:anthranilate synthase/aminodeoxychorismate synthase-like glutamine amidotransferase
MSRRISRSGGWALPSVLALPMMIFVLDNYDSFTYNLVQRLGEIDRSLEIRVARNDQTTPGEIERLKPDRIIISPGPCTPNEAGISKSVIERLGSRVPVLGVCLGHQCIGEVYGGKVLRADRLMHGKVSQIHHDGKGVFAGLPSPFMATRYHSLVIPSDALPGDLELCAWTEDSDFPREIMGVRHRRFPVHGVQFHPESFLTECGIELLRNFLRLPSGARTPQVEAC